MHLSPVRKNTDLVGIFTAQDIAVLRIRCLFVPFIRSHVNGLCISETIHQEHNIHFFDLLFLKDRFRRVLDRGSPWHRVFFLITFQLFYDHFCHRRAVTQNILVFRDML